jgi:endonuclease/exonuclease/phosphatase family metal-dependent hydrolase
MYRVAMKMPFLGLLLLLMPNVGNCVPNSHVLTVLSFNILAPCWASPSLYPASSLPLLDRTFRRARIVSFLEQHASKTDIFALQETTEVELGYIKEAMKNQFELYAAYHSPNYWSSWITVNPAPEPHGVALLIKKDLLANVHFTNLPLAKDGNHAALIEAVLKQSPSKRVRVASIHLDSDKSDNRKTELEALLSKMPAQSKTLDIIAGDFNTEITNTNLEANIISARFTDILTSLKKNSVTSPFKTWGNIDHILVRHATPLSGEVIHFGLWEVYPNNEEARINASLSISGSDHFPVTGSVEY